MGPFETLGEAAEAHDLDPERLMERILEAQELRKMNRATRKIKRSR